MYETGGPGVFSNITWIRDTFGEKVAKRYNIFLAWGIIAVAIAFILIRVWLHVAILTGK